MLPAFMGVVFLYGVAHFLGLEAGARPRCRRASPIDATVVLGLAGTVLAFALFVCTGDDLRVPAVPARMGDAADGRSTTCCWAAPRASRWPPRSRRRPRRRSSGSSPAWALVLTLLGFASRVASLVRNARLRPKSTLQTAIGIKHPRIVQKSQGFMGGSFNTREFFHGRTRARPALGQMVVPASARSRCRRCCWPRRWRARRRHARRRVRRAVRWACSPSAGSSSRRRTIRRTSTTRRSPETCAVDQAIACRDQAWLSTCQHSGSMAPACAGAHAAGSTPCRATGERHHGAG